MRKYKNTLTVALLADDLYYYFGDTFSYEACIAIVDFFEQHPLKDTISLNYIGSYFKEVSEKDYNGNDVQIVEKLDNGNLLLLA